VVSSQLTRRERERVCQNLTCLLTGRMTPSPRVIDTARANTRASEIK
jgi:hypothetical protein